MADIPSNKLLPRPCCYACVHARQAPIPDKPAWIGDEAMAECGHHGVVLWEPGRVVCSRWSPANNAAEPLDTESIGSLQDGVIFTWVTVEYRVLESPDVRHVNVDLQATGTIDGYRTQTVAEKRHRYNASMNRLFERLKAESSMTLELEGLFQKRTRGARSKRRDHPK